MYKRQSQYCLNFIPFSLYVKQYAGGTSFISLNIPDPRLLWGLIAIISKIPSLSTIESTSGCFNNALISDPNINESPLNE